MKKILIPAFLLFAVTAFAQTTEVETQPTPVRTAPSVGTVSEVNTAKPAQQQVTTRVKPASGTVNYMKPETGKSDAANQNTTKPASSAIPATTTGSKSKPVRVVKEDKLTK